MSIINTMLKDLDRRGVEYRDSDDAILSGLEAAGGDDDTSGRGNPVLISVASVLVVIAVLGLGYYISPYQLTAASQVQVSAVQEPEIEPETKTSTGKSVVDSGTQAVSAAVKETDVTPEQPVQQTETVSSVSKPAQQVKQAEPEPVTAGNEPEPAKATASTRAPEKPVEVVAEKEVVADKTVQQKPMAAAEIEIADEEPMHDEDFDLVSKKQREFSPQEKSQQAYAEALEYYNEGSRQSAKASLQSALELSAVNKEARILLAAMYIEDGKPQIAAEMVAEGLSFAPEDQQLLRLYLQAQVKAGNFSQAIAVMEERLRLTRPEDFGYLAGLYQKNNDHISAVKMYARALQLRPSNSIWWMGQGISFEMLQQYDEAIRAYQQSLSTGRLSGKLSRYATSRINSIKQLNGDSVS